jgi:hypothetical protein
MVSRSFGKVLVKTLASFTIEPSVARAHNCDSLPPRSMATCCMAVLLEMRFERVTG